MAGQVRYSLARAIFSLVPPLPPTTTSITALPHLARFAEVTNSPTKHVLRVAAIQRESKNFKYLNQPGTYHGRIFYIYIVALGSLYFELHMVMWGKMNLNIFDLWGP